MTIPFQKLSLATKVLVLLELYSDPSQGIRIGDLLHSLNNEERKDNLLITNKSLLDKAIKNLENVGLITFKQDREGTDKYYFIKDIFLLN